MEATAQVAGVTLRVWKVHSEGRQWNWWLWLGMIDPWGKDEGRGWLMSS